MDNIAPSPGIPVIDTHIHLYDPTRPQGVPWPRPDNGILYKKTLPDRFRAVAEPFGVVGAVEVECSPWFEDNQWVLDIAKLDTIVVGKIGNFLLGEPESPRRIEALAANPLFRGIRYSSLWGRDADAEMARPRFFADLRRMADAGLTLDTNANPPLFANAIRIADAVPGLRIVIDHLPSYQPPGDPRELAAFESQLQEIARRPQIYAKVSEVLHAAGGPRRRDPDVGRAKMDRMYELFGPDRLLYGSDWPVLEESASYAEAFGQVRDYFLAKGREVAEKFFWRNSAAAYRWVRRDPGQPDPAAV